MMRITNEWAKVMGVSEKNYYEMKLVSEFRCLGKDCPATCCGNWNVAVDDETYKHMLKAKGMTGFRLRLLTLYDKKAQSYMICRSVHHCPFYKKHLCELQTKGMTECMPKVCRVYPRRTVDYGTRVETSLELSCIYAAALFVRQAGRTDYLPAKAPEEIFWTQNNEDEDFLSFLLSERERIMDYWWGEDETDLLGRLRAIYTYVYAEYMWIVRDKRERVKELALPVEGELRAELRAPRIGLNRSKVGLYPLRFINELIFTYLDYQGMQVQTPALYRLITRYRKLWGKVYEKDAEDFALENYTKMVSGQPELEGILQAYFGYLFMQTYAEAFEDYYILGPVLLAALHAQFLTLFYMVEYMDHGIVTVGRQAEILSVMEKGVRHKNELNGLALQAIRETYFAPREE